MDQERIFAALSRRFVNYQELSPIPVVESGEVMRDVTDFGLHVDLSFSNLSASTGDRLFLRQGVCERLVAAEKILQSDNRNFRLVLVYAYRSLEIQVENFKKMRRELGLGDRTDPEAMERAHHFIAVPDVAGHPTGGAIDLLIIDENGKTLDFGTGIHALEQNSYAYSPYISDAATINRKRLRAVMTAVGFAPYDGEWWHFSYGEREWAAYYKEPLAFYSQLSEETISALL